MINYDDSRLHEVPSTPLLAFARSDSDLVPSISRQGTPLSSTDLNPSWPPTSRFNSSNAAHTQIRYLDFDQGVPHTPRSQNLSSQSSQCSSISNASTAPDDQLVPRCSPFLFSALQDPWKDYFGTTHKQLTSPAIFSPTVSSQEFCDQFKVPVTPTYSATSQSSQELIRRNFIAKNSVNGQMSTGDRHSPASHRSQEQALRLSTVFGNCVKETASSASSTPVSKRSKVQAERMTTQLELHKQNAVPDLSQDSGIFA